MEDSEEEVLQSFQPLPRRTVPTVPLVPPVPQVPQQRQDQEQEHQGKLLGKRTPSLPIKSRLSSIKNRIFFSITDKNTVSRIRPVS
jgi:hypothetical protein